MHFQILGPLRVTDADDRDIALGGAKPAALLAMLVLHANEVVSADRLIDDLWDSQPPATAAKTLQVHISRLRRALEEASNGDGGAIVTRGGGYVLQVQPDQVDALRFESLVAEGRAALAEGAHARASARLRAALALWHGEALADFAYASFAQDAIARLEGLRTVALESAVEAELALGRHAELIPELKSLVRRNPLSEHLHGQLMLALYRAGRQAEALGVYRAARRVLVDQLGLEPRAELRDLEAAILAHDAGLAAPAPQHAQRRERVEQSPRGVLVGYERELGALEDVLEQALAGHGRVAFISGEPGVGKTRLADELSGVADKRGAQVVWGRCGTGAGAPAYWPWIQVLRALLADRDPLTLRAELGSAAAALSQLMPELQDLLPEADEGANPDAEEARFRLLDAVAAFLARTAATGPVVIVLDDLHVADHSTLSMLEFIGPAALDAPVLVLGTYRDTELVPGNPLSGSLNELGRTTDCLQLVLTGLSDEDTAHFVELSAGVAPMPALAGAIHEASGGNPLFVSEVVRLLRAEDRLHELARDDTFVLPRGVDQVIARRLEHLSEACRQTLTVAAVIGREFDATLLARAAGATGDELLRDLEAAVSARVVEERPGGGFRFSHELVRHSLEAGLGAGQRRRLHVTVGAALEGLNRGRVDSVVAALAHHYSEALPAGDPVKAMRYLTLAGDRAADLAAGHEAASYYTRALELAKAGGAEADELCDLHVKLAEQLVAIPDLFRLKAVIDEAEALAASAPDRVREGRIAVVRAHLHMLDASALDEDALFDAITLFEEIGDPVGAARGWSALVTLNCGRSDRLKGGEAAERMLDCGRRAGSKALVGVAMRNVASLLAMGSAPTSQALVRVRALFAEAEDGFTRARILTSTAHIESFRGRFDEARALLAEATALVPRGEDANLRGFVLAAGAHVELLAGNWQRAEELARMSCADLESQGLVRYLSSELMYLVDALSAQGRFDEALVHLERAAPLAAPDDADALFRQARSRGYLELARGDLEAAERAMREALDIVERAKAPDEHAETLLAYARLLIARGRDDEARAAAAEALAISEEREHLVFAQRARELLGTAERAVVAG